MFRNNYVTVDLAAIRNNYQVLRNCVPSHVRVMPVIKADAYGHGMIPVAKTLQMVGVEDFAVALVEEGIALRQAGITARILVLGAAMLDGIGAAVANDLTLTVFSEEQLMWVETEATRRRKTASVHIKLDTGMNRIGLRTDEEAIRLSTALAQTKFVKATGIYTHFASADEPMEDGSLNAFSHQQLERFIHLRSHFDDAIPAHVANSAMSLLAPEAYFSMIREGISLYGYPPVKTVLSFTHALSWHTEIVHIKEIKKGETVGYGRTFTAEKDMRLATIAVGYGDGYHRTISNKGAVLISGKRAPIVGRICMDQTMVDISHIPEADVGDEVVLIGTQQAENITAEEVASWADTISYEVLLGITARVPRLYMNA
ncbi:MAG: alanine racemase [Clostridia bacterium]|nr:alanine racemase [Clostridia bacterium]MBP3648254.1 alanine racemase [Clostridia bacterium]